MLRMRKKKALEVIDVTPLKEKVSSPIKKQTQSKIVISNVDIDMRLRKLGMKLESLNFQRKEISKAEDEIKKEVNELMDNNVQADTAGHRFFKIPKGDSFFYVKREAVTKTDWDKERAKDLFKRKSLYSKIVKRKIISEEYFDEEAIEKAVAEGKLTQEEILSVMTSEISNYKTKIVYGEEEN